jgi:hypothetical protein
VTAPTPVALRPDFCDGVKIRFARRFGVPAFGSRRRWPDTAAHIPPGYGAPSPPRPIAKITENLDVLLAVRQAGVARTEIAKSST